VEVYAAHGPVVLVESVEECAHAVVPHLDDPAVEAGEDPWPARVEGEPLDAVALGLELGQHLGAALRRPAGPLNPPAGERDGGRSQVGGSGLSQLDLGEEKKKMCCPLLLLLFFFLISFSTSGVVGIFNLLDLDQ
jgi:hypothetical protein